MFAWFRRTSLHAVLALMLVVLPLCAVTTAKDVQRALERATAATPGEVAPLAAQRDLSDLFVRLRELRSKARDFAIGSVIVAAARARNPEALLAEAQRRVDQAGLSRAAADENTVATEVGSRPFVPSVDIHFSAVADHPSWIAAHVRTAVPCGEDVSLLLWTLPEAENTGKLLPKLEFARESAFEDLSSSSGLADYSIAPSGIEGTYHVALIETGIWCNSQWKRTVLSVLRTDQQPFRPARLFRQDDLAFLAGEPSPGITAGDSGFLFEYAGHYWLNPLHHSRRIAVQVQIDGDRAMALPPTADDPIEFLDQWLASPWDASRSWTTGRHQDALQAWHQNLSPADRSRTVAEAAGNGGCQHDPHTLWVRLVTLPEEPGKAEVFGLLRRQTSGYRLDQFVEKLPAGCPLAGEAAVP
jgi:hypothetical protein